MVVWIRDGVLMKLEKNPSPLKTAAGNAGVSGQRSGGSDCVKTCQERTDGPGRYCPFQAPGRWLAGAARASVSADEEVSLDVFVPTPIATVRFPDKEVLKEKTQQLHKKPRQHFFHAFKIEF